MWDFIQKSDRECLLWNRRPANPLFLLLWVDGLLEQDKAGDNFSATVFNSLGGSSSGPQALNGLSWFSCLNTPSWWMIKFGMLGNGNVPLSGTGSSDGGLKTDWKCWFRASALSASVVHNLISVRRIIFGSYKFHVRPKCFRTIHNAFTDDVVYVVDMSQISLSQLPFDGIGNPRKIPFTTLHLRWNMAVH